MKPRIFISAVTREFSTARQQVANILLRLGYDPVWEDIFGSEPGDLRPILRGRMDECTGFIQLVGHGYGAEPPPPWDPPNERASYTQFEFDYVKKLGRKTWLIFPGEGCSRDLPLAQLDLPRDPRHPDPAGFQAERRALQAAYRQRLRASEHLYHDPQNDAELELTIERMEPDLRRLNKGFRRWQVFVAGGIVVLGLLIGLQIITSRQESARQLAAQQVSKERIRAHLMEASETKLAEDLAAAEQAAGWEEREQLRQAARGAHASRLARVDDLAATFAQIEGRSDSSGVLRELTRILRSEGVEAAVAYAERQRPELMARVRKRQAALHEQNRIELTPLLQAAGLRAAKGDATAARALYRDLLLAEPAWPEALENFTWFLFDQAALALTHGTMTQVLDLSEEGLGHAEHHAFLQPDDPAALRALTASLNLRAEVLMLRGQPGDAEVALGRYQRSLQLLQKLEKTHPDTAQIARDIAMSLEKLADFLTARGQPGDRDQALAHYRRSLELSERQLKATPNSAQAARDVAVSLNKLADFLGERGQPGDFAEALAASERSLTLREGLLRASPNSAEAARDVSVSQEKVADLLTSRGQPGDAERALALYQRGLEITEQSLQASPDSAQAARDVSVSLVKLADFLALRGAPGDAEKALDCHRRSLEVRERLLQANANSAQAARDVSVSLDRLGDFLAQRRQPGDVAAAQAHYQRGLELRERLLKDTPDSARAARDVSVSLNKLANLLAASDNPADHLTARRLYERSLELSERLLKANPDSAEAARDVSVSLELLGDFLFEHDTSGGVEQALGFYQRSLQLRQPLLQASPDSAQAARDVAVAHLKLALFHQQHGPPATASAELASCFGILDSFARAGRPMDEAMRELHARLKPRFAPAAKPAPTAP